MDDFADVFGNRNKLRCFYDRYNPEKGYSVDAVLTKYEGQEDKLFKMLELKYKGQIKEWREKQKKEEEPKKVVADSDSDSDGGSFGGAIGALHKLLDERGEKEAAPPKRKALGVIESSSDEEEEVQINVTRGQLALKSEEAKPANSEEAKPAAAMVDESASSEVKKLQMKLSFVVKKYGSVADLHKAVLDTERAVAVAGGAASQVDKMQLVMDKAMLTKALALEKDIHSAGGPAPAPSPSAPAYSAPPLPAASAPSMPAASAPSLPVSAPLGGEISESDDSDDDSGIDDDSSEDEAVRKPAARKTIELAEEKEEPEEPEDLLPSYEESVDVGRAQVPAEHLIEVNEPVEPKEEKQEKRERKALSLVDDDSSDDGGFVVAQIKRDASKRDKEERKRHQAEDDDEELARQLMYDEQEAAGQIFQLEGESESHFKERKKQKILREREAERRRKNRDENNRVRSMNKDEYREENELRKSQNEAELIRERMKYIKRKAESRRKLCHCCIVSCIFLIAGGIVFWWVMIQDNDNTLVTGADLESTLPPSGP